MIEFENLEIIIPIGLVMIVLTFYIILTGDRNQTEKKLSFFGKKIHIHSYSLDVVISSYLFLVLMMVIIGFLSNFIFPTIVGTIFATVPVLLVFLVNYIGGKRFQ